MFVPGQSGLIFISDKGKKFYDIDSRSSTTAITATAATARRRRRSKASPAGPSRRPVSTRGRHLRRGGAKRPILARPIERPARKASVFVAAKTFTTSSNILRVRLSLTSCSPMLGLGGNVGQHLG